MVDVSYGDLRKARSAIFKQAGAKNPGHGSMDTMTPMVKLGLEVVQFEVEGAHRFAEEITSKNLFRISIAKGNYAVMLFAAALQSGMAYGAMAERRR